MRKLLAIAAAALCLLGPTAASAAQGRGGGEGRGRAEARGDGDRERQRPSPAEGYGRDRAPQASRQRAPDPRFEPREEPRAPRGLAPGQTMPPGYRGAPMRDFERYRLRPPPSGYDWVQVGPDIYLTQRSTGMVLEAIPGGR